MMFLLLNGGAQIGDGSDHRDRVYGDHGASALNPGR